MDFHKLYKKIQCAQRNLLFQNRTFYENIHDPKNGAETIDSKDFKIDLIEENINTILNNFEFDTKKELVTEKLDKITTEKVTEIDFSLPNQTDYKHSEIVIAYVQDIDFNNEIETESVDDDSDEDYIQKPTNFNKNLTGKTNTFKNIESLESDKGKKNDFKY